MTLWMMETDSGIARITASTAQSKVDRKPGFSWNRVYGSKMMKEPGTRSGSGSRFYYIKSENLKNASTCHTTEKYKLYELPLTLITTIDNIYTIIDHFF